MVTQTEPIYIIRLSIIAMSANIRVLILFVTLFFTFNSGDGVMADNINYNSKRNDRIIGNTSDLLLVGFDEISSSPPVRSYEGKQMQVYSENSSTDAEIIQLITAVVLKCGGETAPQNQPRGRPETTVENYDLKASLEANLAVSPAELATGMGVDHTTIFRLLLQVGKQVSWFFYQCLGEKGDVKKVRLTTDASDHGKYYVLSFAGDHRKSLSFLRIRNVNAEETTGLYRCDVKSSPVESESHYFVVGKKKSLRKCFPSNDLDDKRNLFKAIQNLVRAAERGPESQRTYEYILKLPWVRGRTHEYKLRFALPGDRGVKAPNLVNESERDFGNTNAIKFEISDASAPSWIENFIRGKR